MIAVALFVVGVGLGLLLAALGVGPIERAMLERIGAIARELREARKLSAGVWAGVKTELICPNCGASAGPIPASERSVVP